MLVPKFRGRKMDRITKIPTLSSYIKFKSVQMTLKKNRRGIDCNLLWPDMFGLLILVAQFHDVPRFELFELTPTVEEASHSFGPNFSCPTQDKDLRNAVTPGKPRR